MNRTSKLKVPLLDDATLSPQVAWQDAFNRVEKGMLGESVISVSGADQTLVGDQARFQILTVEGMDEVPRSLILPVGVDAARPHIVRNTTGQTLTVKTTAVDSVGVVLPANSNQYVYNTGLEVVQFTVGLGDVTSINGVPVSPTPLEDGQTYALVGGVLTPVDFPTGGGGDGGGGDGGTGGSTNYVQPDEPPADAPIGTGWLDTNAPTPGNGSGNGGSGTGWPPFHPDAPPSEPTAWDDEFTGESLDPKWTQLNVLNPFHFANSKISVKGKEGLSEYLQILFQNLPAGDCEFRAKVTLNSFYNTFDIVGMCVLDSNNTIQVLQLITANGWSVSGARWNSATQFYDNFLNDSPSPTGGNLYMSIRIKSSDNTVHFSASADGHSYYELASSGLGFWLANYSKVGIFFRALSANNHTETTLSVDWFRRVA